MMIHTEMTAMMTTREIDKKGENIKSKMTTTKMTIRRNIVQGRIGNSVATLKAFG
jgi:hypothetical protein